VALEIDLHLPQAHSLKDKRALVRPILDGARNRFSVASGEVAFQDKWQRARLGFACVGPDGDGHAFAVLTRVERFVWSFPEVEVLNTEMHTYGTDA